MTELTGEQVAELLAEKSLQPVFVQHLEKVYKALEERATMKVLHLDDVSRQELVFVGGITEVYQSTGISQAYYGPIFNALDEAGAILRVQRGGKNVDTVIVLRGLPEVWPEELITSVTAKKDLTNANQYATVMAEIQKLRESLGGLSIVEVLFDFESRIAALEARENDINGTEQTSPTNGTRTGEGE